MKTTIEINDELLLQVKARAREEGRTLREQVEEGLRLLMRRAPEPRRRRAILPVSKATPGLTPEFENADWAAFKAAARER